MASEDKLSVRDAILLSAKELFWKNGLSKVTVEEICEHAKISKMSFYRSFKNKVDVLKVLLLDFTDEGMQMFDVILSGDAPLAKKLHEVMLFKQERAKGMSPVLLSDIYSREPQLLQELQESTIAVQTKFKQALIAARDNGELRSDIKIEFIIYMVNHFNERMLGEDLLQIFENMEDATHQLTEFFYYGLLGKDPYA